MIVVTKTDKATGSAVRVEIPEGQDPFAVCAQVARAMGFKIHTEDPVHDAIMARRRDAAHAGVGSDSVDRAAVGGDTTESRGRLGDVHGPTLPDSARREAKARARDSRSWPALGAGVPGAAEGGADRGATVPLGMGTAAPSVGVRASSVEAYRKARWSGKLTRQQEQVVAWLRGRIGDATRQEIAAGTGLGINCICGRVNELLDPEIGVLIETRKRKCCATGETANALRLA